MVGVLERKEAENKEGSKEIGERSSARVKEGVVTAKGKPAAWGSGFSKISRGRHHSRARAPETSDPWHLALLHPMPNPFQGQCVTQTLKTHSPPSVPTNCLGPTPPSHPADVSGSKAGCSPPNPFWVYCCLWDGGWTPSFWPESICGLPCLPS